MKLLRTHFLLAFAGLTVSTASSGAVGPLLRLIDQADLIAVGDASSGSQTGYAVTFNLVIDRILKSSGTTSSVCTVNWESPFPAEIGSKRGATIPLAKRRGLWFLNVVSAGQCRLLPAWSGLPFEFTSFPIPPGAILADFAYGQTAATPDKIAQELGAAAEYFGGKGFEVSFAERFNTWVSPTLRNMYDRLSRSSSANVRTLGLSGLIRLGDPSAIVRAESEIAVLDRTSNAADLWSSISCFREIDPAAVQALARMLTNMQLASNHQFTIVDVLSAIHTRDTLPSLAAMLSSTSKNVRELAVAGMSSFTRNLPVSTFENTKTGAAERSQGNGPYKTEDADRHFFKGAFPSPAKEAELITFWSGWWGQHRMELSQ